MLFEGLLGVVDGTLQETTYDKAKSEGDKKGGIAYDATATGGWAGITDKYWLTALIPDQAVPAEGEFPPHRRRSRRPLPGGLHHRRTRPRSRRARPPASRRICSPAPRWCACWTTTRREYHIPNFDKAVDFGWFYS